MTKKRCLFANLILGLCLIAKPGYTQEAGGRSAEAGAGSGGSPDRWVLKEDWKMQSAMTDTADGARISTVNYDVKDWYPVSVPTTIVGGLLANKIYLFDPFMGQNLQKLSDPKLDKPWWFRRELRLPPSAAGKHIMLILHGINYTANVWLNGTMIADSTQVKGPFRIIELDITKYARAGKDGGVGTKEGIGKDGGVGGEGENVLALEITRPFHPNKDGGDLAIDYADWIPYPPDYNGGIVNDVEIKTYHKVGIEYPVVTTRLEMPGLTMAHLTVDARVRNYENASQEAVVKGVINGSLLFERRIHLKALESADVSFGPDDFPSLNISNPRVWWPWQYGKPELNHIELSVMVGGRVSNTIAESFGIREMTSRLINDQSREFLINGRPILLRGAAWSPDIFQRRSEERQEQEIRLVRDMNMNVIRSEGKLEDDHFYELCDKYGMLVMTGWMCCGAWQHPEHWSPAERTVALASDSSVMYWLRNKASLLVWLNGSDMPPTDTSLERAYLTIEQSLKWPNPVIATADGRKSKVSGFSGVKMLGPYEWVPPIYWETDSAKKFGGAWSFATEISPGPSIPPYESLIKFIPKDSLLPSSGDWHYHSGTGFFGTTDIFNQALGARYGAYSSIKNYAAKAQAQDYEAHRAMMEAYGLHKYHTATGVVQWMLSNPWPGLIWHTYDYYLYPAGTYFGMKKAMEPLHVMYSYASNSVAIINSTLQRFSGLQVKAAVYNLDGALKYTKIIRTDLDEDAAKTCWPLPVLTGLSDTYFLRLELTEAGGKAVSINWYWLSAKGDILNWKKSNWYTTPEASYADYSALSDMPETTLEMRHTGLISGDSTVQELKLTNTGKAVAFFLHLRALGSKDGGDILPVIFSDDYISLAPGETRLIRCHYRSKDAEGANPYFLISGWNLDIGGSKGDDGVGFEEGLPK